MSLCAQCGTGLAGDAQLCVYHPNMNGAEWSESNRLMCDFFHRGVVPARLSERERDDNYWPGAYAVDSMPADVG